MINISLIKKVIFVLKTKKVQGNIFEVGFVDLIKGRSEILRFQMRIKLIDHQR